MNPQRKARRPPLRSTTSRISANWTARPRTSRISHGPPEWKRPPAPRTGRGQQRGHGDRRQWLAAHFNRPITKFSITTSTHLQRRRLDGRHPSEAASLAGHLKLPNLCWIYDNNHITLDGPADWSYTEDVGSALRGYGWNVVHVTDANDLDMLSKAYKKFLQPTIADTDHCEQPHRLRIAAQAGHQRRARRAAGRGRSEARQRNSTAGRKMRSSWCRMECSTFPARALASAAEAHSGSGSRCSPNIRKKFPELAEQLESDAASRTA